MKCVRPNCTRVAAAGGRNKGLCDSHYSAVPRGYVPAGPIRERLLELNRAGFSWRAISEMTGLTEQGLYHIRDTYKRVQVGTAQKVMRIPSPEPFSGDGIVSAVGSHRRVRALQALGWTQRELESRLGWGHRRLGVILGRSKIAAKNAKAISDLYDQLSMTTGPSEKTRRWAKKLGFVPPLAWDDIDDPDEIPEFGDDRWVPFMERLEELRYLHVRVSEMPQRLGIQVESFERQLRRHALKEAV